MDLAKPNQAIRMAVTAGIVLGVFTSLLTFMAAVGIGVSVVRFSFWQVMNIAAVFGLTYGVHKKSRASAVVLFVYFVLDKTLALVILGQASGLLLFVAFAYFLFQGVRGTLAYHKVTHPSLCPKCGSGLSQGRTSCPSCGISILEFTEQRDPESKPEEYVCPACGADIQIDQRRCPDCGAELDWSE